MRFDCGVVTAFLLLPFLDLASPSIWFIDTTLLVEQLTVCVAYAPGNENFLWQLWHCIGFLGMRFNPLNADVVALFVFISIFAVLSSINFSSS